MLMFTCGGDNTGVLEFFAVHDEGTARERNSSGGVGHLAKEVELSQL